MAREKCVAMIFYGQSAKIVVTFNGKEKTHLRVATHALLKQRFRTL